MVVGGAGGGRDEDVAWGGEECPEEQGEPAYARPTEEQVEEEDSGDGVAVMSGDDGGEEVEKDKDRKRDHACGLRAA